MSQQHQLAVVLFTDIIGYTALMQENEQKAVALIKHYNAALERTVAAHKGKVLNYYVNWLKVEPLFNSLHNDPRFKGLLKKVGFK